MFLAEQRSIPLNESKNLEQNFSNVNDIKENVENYDDNYDVNLIILHRSLYILKKKFEKYKNEFKDIYNKYREIITGDNILQNEILVEENKVNKILEEILNVGKFGLIEFNNFKEAVFNEMNLIDKIKLNENISNELMDFVLINRRKYNYIFTQKKLNKNFQLENYTNYIPEGEDELTKIVMETEKCQKNKKTEKDKENDIKSEIITTTNKIEENQTENINKEKEDNEDNEEENEEEEDDEEKKEEEEKEKVALKKKKLKPKTVIKDSQSYHSEYDNNKKVQYSKSYIYIESLLLILADFISDKSKNKSYIIIDHSDELRNELRTLFDNEILGRLGEEIQYEVNKNKLEHLKDLLLNKTKIVKNISNYEDLLYKMRTKNQNTDFVIITINKLKQTLNWLSQKIQILQDDTNTFNEFENAIQIKQINREMRKHKRNKNINNQNNQINPQISNVDKLTMDSSKPGKEQKLEKSNEDNLDELSDISILKLDNKIEGLDTDRLVDLNIIDASNNEENSVFLQKKKEKKFINQNKVYLPKIKVKNLSKEERREMNIKEIFNFYSHLHTNAGHKLTFDSIKEKLDHLNLNEFLKFCKEFKILLPKEILSKIFLKKSELTKEMSYLEFNVTLNEISIAINEEKIKQLKKRVKKYKNDNEKELIKKCNDEITLLKLKSKEELLEEFYEYLEIDDCDKYRKKMKGYELPIFYSNIYNNHLNNKVKINENKKTPIKLNSARQIYLKEIIQLRKDQKKLLEKKLIRVTGLDREYQKKKLDINNQSLLKSKSKLVPSDKSMLNRYNKSVNIKNKNKNNKMINLYEKNYEKDNYKNNDRYDFVKEREEEARRDILKKLNLKINDFNENNNNVNNNNDIFKEMILKNKNNKNTKENKYSWDMLSNMKSNSLVTETELNNLIN